MICQVVDKSAATVIPHEWSKLISCTPLWSRVTLSTAILMMWIHSGGWTPCCERDLRRLLFSFLSTRGRTLKVNQRPHILTRMFGLVVTSTHSERRVFQFRSFFMKDTPNGGCIFYGGSFFKHISPLATNDSQKRQKSIWKYERPLSAWELWFMIIHVPLDIRPQKASSSLYQRSPWLRQEKNVEIMCQI